MVASRESQGGNSSADESSCVLYTVRKGRCNFKLRKHDTYHLMGISTLCNVKMCDINVNVE
jgi:hypothetical protein